MTDLDQLPIGGAYVHTEAPAAEAPASLNQLIHDYADARTLREMNDDEGKRLREVETQYEAKLFDELERLTLRSVKHERGNFILSDLAWAAVTDVALSREWIEAEMPEILSPNATRLAVVVREAIRGEREMPPGIEAKFTRRINWRRS